MKAPPLVALDAGEQLLLELFATPGATVTPEQSEAWKVVRDRIQADTYNQALSILLNYRHWFEHDPKAFKGFMIVHDQLNQRATP